MIKQGGLTLGAIQTRTMRQWDNLSRRINIGLIGLHRVVTVEMLVQGRLAV
jgi:hypothetical protein